jgi:hypothetical protein
MEQKKVVGFIPKILFKVFLYLKDKFDPKPILSEEEKFAAEICEKLISNSESELTFSPLSNKRIIKNSNKNMFIVMESMTIHLINHVYSYSVFLQDTERYKELVQNFDNVLEEKRKSIEWEIRDNIQHSLKDILNKLD